MADPDLQIRGKGGGGGDGGHPDPEIRGVPVPTSPSPGSATGLVRLVLPVYFEFHRPKTIFDAESRIPPSCRGNRDSLEFWIPRCGFLISRHWISVVSRIHDFLKLYSGFQSLGFRISEEIFFRIPDSTN